MSHVLVVGGGCFGLSTALELIKRGYTVSIFDPSTKLPSEEAASADVNKIVRWDYGNDQIYTNMGAESLKIWKEWSDESRTKFFHKTGVLFLSHTKDSNTFEGSSLKYAKEHPELTKIVGGPLTTEEFSYPVLETMKKKLPGGYLSLQSGWVHSTQAIEFMVEKIKKTGKATFYLGPKSGTFKEFAYQGDEIVGIKTHYGTYKGLVVIAAGSWCPDILPELKSVMHASAQPVVHVRIPKEKIQSYNSIAVWAADTTKTGFCGFPASNDGIMKIAHHGAGYVYHTGKALSHPTDYKDFPKNGFPKDAVLKFRNFFKEYFPTLNDFDIAKTRLCWYADSFDADFFITPIPKRKNVILVSGGSGHAFKFTPVLGKVAADVIQGKSTPETQRFKWRENPTSSNGIPQVLDSMRLADPVKYLKDMTPATPQDLLAHKGRL